MNKNVKIILIVAFVALILFLVWKFVINKEEISEAVEIVKPPEFSNKPEGIQSESSASNVIKRTLDSQPNLVV